MAIGPLFLPHPNSNSFEFGYHNLAERREQSSIQYFNKKCETNAQVFSRTHAHGNSKNGIGQHIEVGEKSEYVKNYSRLEKITHDGLNVAWVYRLPGVAEQLMNFLTNLTYTYNPSITPWGR